MAIVYHPTFTDHSLDVPDSEVADWLQQGWTTDSAKRAEPETDAADAAYIPQEF